MINNHSKHVLNYFNIGHFIETGTYMGETLMKVKSWDFNGSIDAVEIEKEYCQISATWNILAALELIDGRPIYDTTYSINWLINSAAKLSKLIYDDEDTRNKYINLQKQIIFEKEKWDLYKIAKNCELNCIGDHRLEVEKIKNFNIHLSDTRRYLEKILPNHKNKNTFFYLDAHWDENDYPLLEELELLSSISHLTPIIAIDDFKTPGKAFGYDHYKNAICGADYIKDTVKDVTDTIYCCPNSNMHNRGQGFIFYNRNKKDIQTFLDKYPFIEIPIK